MNRRQFLAFCMAAFMAACSREKTYVSPLPEGSLLALGDSLTEGYGADAASAYPAVLAELTGRDVINGGVSGDTSADILVRLPSLLEEKPVLVLLGIGGNDFLRRIPEETTRANIRAAIKTIRDKNIPVVLIAEPHLSTGTLLTGSLSDHPLFADIARKEGVLLFSDGWSSVLSDRSLKSDQIHANAQGYRVFAEKLTEFLHKQGLL